MISLVCELWLFKYCADVISYAFTRKYFKPRLLLHNLSGILTFIIGTCGWLMISLNHKFGIISHLSTNQYFIMFVFNPSCLFTITNILSGIKLITRIPYRYRHLYAVFITPLFLQTANICLCRLICFYENKFERRIMLVLTLSVVILLIFRLSLVTIKGCLFLLGIMSFKVDSYVADSTKTIKRKKHVSVIEYIKSYIPMGNTLQSDPKWTFVASDAMMLISALMYFAAAINMHKTHQFGLISDDYKEFNMYLCFIFMTAFNLLTFQASLLFAGKVKLIQVMNHRVLLILGSLVIPIIINCHQFNVYTNLIASFGFY